MSQREHILLRPDSYVGSIEQDSKVSNYQKYLNSVVKKAYLQSLWILNKEGTAMEEKIIEFVPAFYKIFDEIIVNAADNYQRKESGNVMNMIKVVIDEK